jgi:hypothetical protein
MILVELTKAQVDALLQAIERDRVEQLWNQPLNEAYQKLRSAKPR